MANSKELFQELLGKITLTDRSEATAILYYLLETKLNLTQQEILTGKTTQASVDQFSEEIFRINANEPIQYITGVAWFRNKKFFVDKSVLIPRPETELLVQCVIDEKRKNPVILDVGTGSGCIAICLGLEIPGSRIAALDISEDSLKTARRNATTLEASVSFIQSDFLKEEIKIDKLDYLVSNPPYVRQSEKKTMEPNVLDYEPHQALFVPNENPLLFYKELARQGKNLLKSGGKIFTEINSNLGAESKLLFEQEDYKNVKLIKDLEGKERIVSATL